MSRVVSLLAALLTAACLNSPTSPDAVVGTPFELRAGATAALPDGLTIKFDAVRSDSRCPMDAICVWAGEAVVAFSVRAAQSGPETRELSTMPAGSAVDYAAYRIAIAGLAPYPRSSQQIRQRDYVATLLVTSR